MEKVRRPVIDFIEKANEQILPRRICRSNSLENVLAGTCFGYNQRLYRIIIIFYYTKPICLVYYRGSKRGYTLKRMEEKEYKKEGGAP